MIATLKIGSSNELTVTKDNKLYFAFSLKGGNILTDCYKYLSNVRVRELRVVITPMVKLSEGPTEEVKLSSFSAASTDRYCFLSKQDLSKFKDLSMELGLNEFKVYTTFDILKLIGKRKPHIICGKYLGAFVYCIAVDKSGIVEFREVKELTDDFLGDMVKFTNINSIKTEFNTELDGLLKNRYKNIEDISEEELSRIYLNLATDLVKPCRTFSSLSEELDNSEEDEIEDSLDEELMLKTPKTRKPKTTKPKEKKPKTERSKATKPKEKKPKNDDKEPQSLVSKILIIVGCIFAILVAFSLFSNKELNASTLNIKEKSEQLENVIVPMKDNIDYLNSYGTLLDNGGPKDNDTLKKVSEIKIDGLLSEVVVKQDTLGLVVYLAKEEDIDKYTEELAKIITVGEVKKEGKLGLDNTSLNKFIIRGTYK